MSRATQKVNEVIKQKAQAPTKSSQNGGLKAIVEKMKPQIAAALTGTALQPERFTRLVLSTISSTPKLADCTQSSFLAAMMSAAQLGLEPNTSLGQAYLIPYGNQCQFQIGYQGMISLAKRSGLRVTARVVYENDEFSYSYGWDDELHHIPAMGDRGKPIYYYAKYKDQDGFGDFVVLSYEDVLNHAKKFSKTFKKGAWQSDFDAMALKTAIKQVLKFAPLTVEFKQALNSDEGIKNLEPDQVEDINVLDLQPEFIDFEEVDNQEVSDEVAELQKGLEEQENIFK